MSQNREEGGADEIGGATGVIDATSLDLVVEPVPRQVASQGNVRVAIDRVTASAGAPVPLLAYSFTWLAGAGVERVSLPLAIPAVLPDGAPTLTTGTTPEALLTAVLDAYVWRLERCAPAEDVTQRARLVNAIAMVRSALVEVGAYVDGGDGRAPLEVPPLAGRG